MKHKRFTRFNMLVDGLSGATSYVPGIDGGAAGEPAAVAAPAKSKAVIFGGYAVAAVAGWLAVNDWVDNFSISWRYHTGWESLWEGFSGFNLICAAVAVGAVYRVKLYRRGAPSAVGNTGGDRSGG